MREITREGDRVARREREGDQLSRVRAISAEKQERGENLIGKGSDRR